MWTNPLWYSQKVLWNWYHQNAWVDWQHICFGLVGVFFNRESTFIWVLTVLPVPPTSFIRTRQTLYRPICRKNENKLARPLNFTFPNKDDVLSLNNCKFGDFFWSYLSNWAWNIGYHRYFKVCLITWPTHEPCQLATVIYM